MANPTEVENFSNVNGVTYESVFDKSNGRLCVKSTQDVEPIIEANKRIRNDFKDYHKKEFVRVASIPNIKVEELMKNGIWFDKKRFKKWLNDPDNRYFRPQRYVGR